MEWERCLIETMAAFARAEPEWGVNDCCQFVADYLDRMGAPVPMPEYHSRVEAFRLLKEHGLENMMTERLGPPTGPEPGGPVLVTANGEEMPAIYNGSYAVLYDHKEGIARCAGMILKGWPCPA